MDKSLPAGVAAAVVVVATVVAAAKERKKVKDFLPMICGKFSKTIVWCFIQST